MAVEPGKLRPLRSCLGYRVSKRDNAVGEYADQQDVWRGEKAFNHARSSGTAALRRSNEKVRLEDVAVRGEPCRSVGFTDCLAFRFDGVAHTKRYSHARSE
jgi:hypothetical protein